VSARPFVQAAVAAGYEVIALDAFADSDTAQMTSSLHALKYADGAFDAVELEATLKEIALQGPLGLVYGSGFETQPTLLALIERHMPLIGNSVRVVRNMKRAITFFALLDVLNIPRPPVGLQQMSDEELATASWLTKKNGGSGGTHIRRATADIPLESGSYYQQEVQGIPVSLLFAADGMNMKEVGFNQQWLAPTALMPYRYGGAVSHAELPQAVRRQLLTAAQKLTSAVGLRGLNSLDAIMQGERVWVLELNPRLTATFDLYPAEHGQLFELHLQAAAGSLGNWPQLSSKARAHYIVYAPENIKLPESFDWPQWVADIPAIGALIKAGEPVCTVTAEADTAEQAVTLMAERVKVLAKALI
jgi:predicted ATP-grasp superfamily ATP-dependent carboligase